MDHGIARFLGPRAIFSSDLGRRGTPCGSEQPSSADGGSSIMGGSSNVPMGRLGSQWGGSGDKLLDCCQCCKEVVKREGKGPKESTRGSGGGFLQRWHQAVRLFMRDLATFHDQIPLIT